jgi:hypothetical protein
MGQPPESADRAVCLFSLERIEALRSEGHSITPGAIGVYARVLTEGEVQPGDQVAIEKVRTP